MILYISGSYAVVGLSDCHPIADFTSSLPRFRDLLLMFYVFLQVW